MSQRIWCGAACVSFALALIAVAGYAGDPPGPGAAVAAQQKEAEILLDLKGTWKSVKETSDGVEAAGSVESRQFTFDGPRVQMRCRLLNAADGVGETVGQKSFSINPSKSPAEITIYGDNFLMQGIYELHGDELKMAFYGRSEVDRPRSFTTAKEPGNGLPLQVLAFQRVKPSASDASLELEKRVAKAVAVSDRASLHKIAAELQKLSDEQRRALPFRIRENSVEFTFRGDVAVEIGSFDFMEFLIASKDRAYEAMLVCDADELKRLAAVRPFFEKHAGKGRRDWWQARLAWVEDGKPRSAEFQDIFAAVDAKDREEFLDGQEVDQNGFLGGELTTGKNLKCDKSVLPQKQVSAVVSLTLKLDAGDPAK